MKLLYGLGNPDAENESSRHNVGWMILDHFCKSLGGAPIYERDAFREIATSEIFDNDRKIILCKPTRYMNDQGACLLEAAQKYRVDVHSDVLVVYDDLDLPLGKMRLKHHGSPPSHNGLHSIRAALRSDIFWRLKIGIETRIDRNSVSGENFVLGNFTANELKILKSFSDKATAIIQLWITNQCQRAMQLTN